jgi:SAM-dependent methyltransferase
MKLDKQFWDDRYKQNETGWDLSGISPPLKAYIDQLKNKDIDILIPGCGNAYEAEYLNELGFNSVTLLDISPSLVNQLKIKLQDKKGIDIIESDFFEHQNTYDLILEQTFFCALEPKLRPQYVAKMHQLLKPKGKLAGLLFQVEFERQGPPFGGDTTSYKELFSPYFEIKTMSTAYNSILPRANNEAFIILQKK